MTQEQISGLDSQTLSLVSMNYDVSHSISVARACNVPTTDRSIYPSLKFKVKIHVVTSKSCTKAS